MNQKDREKLKKMVVSNSWEGLTAKNLKKAFVMLTEQEELRVIKSIINDSNETNVIFKQKFYEQIEPIAEAKTAEAIETGVIPLNLIKL
jgi:hypothetical protein